MFLKIKKNFAFTYPCPRHLREVVQMSLFQRENKEKISELWKEYHVSKPNNTANVLSSNDYGHLLQQLQKSPLFIWPVQRKGGHFILISQFQKKSILFTYLEDYKTKGANASPYFIMTLFDELLADKGLALMRGDIMDFQLSKQEADYVAHNLINFYISPEIYENFIHKFNHDQHNFDYNKFCKVFEINKS